LYNRALSLLSIPSSLHPFHSSAYHQRAQFNLLRRMTEFEPALTINREGYRAITAARPREDSKGAPMGYDESQVLATMEGREA
jgi:hypothetical protein